MSKILIVEDDLTLLRGISDYFAAHGFQIVAASDGEAAIERAVPPQGKEVDLIILDVMLPKVNGYEVCRYLRQEKIETPIIFLTAKAEESDILLGLGLGADDYLSKPFRIKELLARAEAVLRRSKTLGSRQNMESGEASDSEQICFGTFQLDRRARELKEAAGQKKAIPLSPKEYELLDYFLEHRGIALSRQQIMDSVWGYDVKVTPRSVDRFVTQLRKKIESTPGEFIETVREFGYRFCD